MPGAEKKLLNSRMRVLARSLLHAPGVRSARRVTERVVTPDARIAIDRIDHTQSDFNHQLHHQARRVDQVNHVVVGVEESMPAVLNAISSMNGAARLATRQAEVVAADVGALREQLAVAVAEVARLWEANDATRAALEIGDARVFEHVRPHIDTLAWLMQRVEIVRFEMLNELRFGTREGAVAGIEPKVLNPEALEASPLRVNIGAGHIPLDGFVNVDMRELPGIDVVATIDQLPFESGTLDEIFSSHTVEHFPQEMLRRQLLPYWVSLLKPGGVLTTVAPDLEAMSADFANGTTDFEDFRSVLYGGQEYEGDSHFNGFTPRSFSDLLVEAGLVEPTIVACDRVNGRCKEFEITARKAR